MKHKTSKLLGLLLAVIMVASLLPSTAFAAGLTFTVTNQEELTAALNQTEKVDAINITQSFSVTADSTIKFGGEKINYYSDTVMTIADDVTLTIENGGSIGSFWPSYEGDWVTPPLPNAKIINNGKVVVQSGGSTVADFTRNNGEIVVESGGEAVCCTQNYGTVTVKSGGVYRTSQGTDAENHGVITIEKGGQMESRFGSSIINCSDGTLTLDGVFTCNCVRYDDNDHMWFENAGTVNGSGDVIVRNADPDAGAVSSLDAMIALMMSALGQTGRFDDWSDINIYKQIEVSSYNELKAAFPGDRTVEGEDVEGDSDVIAVLTADVTVTGGEIRTMGKIIVPEKINLIIADGGMLEASIDNNGNTEVEAGGFLATTMGGNITNNGALNVKDGGTLKSQMGGNVVNNDKMILDGEFNCGVYHDSNDGSDTAWFENNGEVTGSGVVTLSQAVPENPADLSAVTAAMQKTLPDTVTVKAAANSPVIEEMDIPVGAVGVEYRGGVRVKDGTGTEPFDFDITDGSLPDGLSYTVYGTSFFMITGTPAAAGTFPFTVTVTDGKGFSDSMDLTIEIVPEGDYVVTVSPSSVTLTAVEGYNADDVYRDITAASTGDVEVDFILAGFKDMSMHHQFGVSAGGMTATVRPQPGLTKGSYSAVVIISDFDCRFASIEVPVTFIVTEKSDSGSGGGGGGNISAQYTLTYETNGGSAVSATKHNSGATVTLTATPTKEGFTFDGWYSDAALTSKITSIKMDGNKTVYAGWKENENPNTGAHDCPSKHLKDVDTNAWYHEYVDYVIENGLMYGIADDRFGPDVTTSRAMIVTILYRLENSPAVSGSSPFEDVAEGLWYTDAVKWAEANEIVEGYSSEKFGPNDLITREQLAAIMYRYSAFKGYDVSKAADLAGYTDASSISDWAVPAMKWAVAEGLIAGRTTTTLVPKGNATRAEAAAILMRYIEKTK